MCLNKCEGLMITSFLENSFQSFQENPELYKERLSEEMISYMKYKNNYKDKASTNIQGKAKPIIPPISSSK